MPAMHQPRKKLTYADFLLFPDDGKRHELINGVQDVVMSDYDVVEPDLLFVGGDQQSILTEANVQGPPALVVEILSPSTRRRDEGIKKRLFDQKGVREYWLVDPKNCSVSVCRRSGDGSFPIVSTISAAADEQLETPLLPGFELSGSELFAEI